MNDLREIIKEYDALLTSLAGAMERLALSIPAPNEITPQFLELVVAARSRRANLQSALLRASPIKTAARPSAPSPAGRSET